jgi:hypothetical protein
VQRRIRRSILFVSVAVLGVVGFGTTAQAGLAGIDAPLNIVKTVSGPVPDGATFTAQLQCDSKIIVIPGGTTDTVTVTFDSTGQPTSQDQYGFDDPGTCTVTETVNGGAATTTFACEGTAGATGSFTGQAIVEDPICPTAGPQPTSITVNIVNPGQSATVTIANTFVAPTPPPVEQPQVAPAVVTQPTFTG